jgi:hypothetical protein
MVLRDKNGKRIGQVLPVGPRTPGEVLQHLWQLEQARLERHRKADEREKQWAEAPPGPPRIAVMGTLRKPDGSRGETFITYEEKLVPPETKPIYSSYPQSPDEGNNLDFMCQLRDRIHERTQEAKRLSVPSAALSPSPEPSRSWRRRSWRRPRKSAYRPAKASRQELPVDAPVAASAAPGSTC